MTGGVELVETTGRCGGADRRAGTGAAIATGAGTGETTAVRVDAAGGEDAVGGLLRIFLGVAAVRLDDGVGLRGDGGVAFAAEAAGKAASQNQLC